MMAHPFRKYKYWIKMISTLVLSPRDHEGFYEVAGDFKREDLDEEFFAKNGLNIIYPFYQYGTYPGYAPAETQYYIPGSSIKGALSLEKRLETVKSTMMVDDIRVNSKDIKLYQLQKVQNILNNDVATEIDVFFPNVAVEMLKADSEYSGELFCEEPERYFRKAHKATKSKLHQLLQKINQIYGQVKKEKDRLILNKLKENIQAILNETQADSGNHFLLLLGGYKGFVLSAILDKADNYNSGIYIDKTKYLPHGLVQVTLEQGGA